MCVGERPNCHFFCEWEKERNTERERERETQREREREREIERKSCPVVFSVTHVALCLLVTLRVL